MVEVGNMGVVSWGGGLIGSMVVLVGSTIAQLHYIAYITLNVYYHPNFLRIVIIYWTPKWLINQFRHD